VASALVGIPHVWWIKEFIGPDHGLSYALGEALSQRLIGWLSRMVVFNSHALATYYSPWINRGKVDVIVQGVDPPVVGPNRVEPGCLRVLLLGRQTATKGTELAVRAVGVLKNESFTVSLRLVGPIETDYRGYLEGIAGEFRIRDRVEFIDFTSTPETHLEWSNVVLMCSFKEGFGRVTAEALKSGRPVIGTRSGGTMEIIADEVDGLLWQAGSVDELSSALRRVGSDPKLLERMSGNARTGSVSRFRLDDEVDRFVSLLVSVAKDSDRVSLMGSTRGTHVSEDLGGMSPREGSLADE
jgi:glycosyltransferase involved in cell wall biosynthesis